MKILFVDINDAESPRTWSGVTSKILNEFRRNHDVILLHKLNKNANYFCIPRIIVRKLQGFQVYLDRTDIVAWYYAKQVKKAYYKYKPDVVFSVTSIPLAHLPDSILSFTWKDSILHDMADFYWSSKLYHKCDITKAVRLDELALQKNCVSIFSSEWAAAGARRIVPESSDRFFVVPFGANVIANPPRHEPKALPDDPSAPINFLFVGANWQRKGGEDCARAVKILRSAGFNVHLSIVGAYPYPNGIDSDFIHQYGFLRPDIAEERTRLQWLHQEAHFFILPSHADCTPIVFADAASHGLPVISRDVGGVSSMVSRDQNSILIQRDDGPDALAQAIRPLLTDADRYRSMSLASLQLSANCLNWETAVERVTNILERFLPR